MRLGINSNIKTLGKRTHRVDCYLHALNCKADLATRETVWNKIFTEGKEKARWWERGKYVLNPEGYFLQSWYIFSNTMFFCAVYNISSQLAFGLSFVKYNVNLEIFFDIIFLIDIILVFFTAA